MADKKINVSANPLPINFKEFSKNPVVATLFITLCGIGYLYLDVKTTFRDQAIAQMVKVERLEQRVDAISDALRRCDSSLATSNTKLSTLEQLGKIQHIK
jgi:uncharacterized Rmd1/YagE family protein